MQSVCWHVFLLLSAWHTLKKACYTRIKPCSLTAEFEKSSLTFLQLFVTPIHCCFGLSHFCLTSSCKLWMSRWEQQRDDMSSRTIWNSDTGLKEGHVLFWGVWAWVWGWRGDSPAPCPAVKIPLGLEEEAVECSWYESGLGLEIAKTPGMQLWAVMSGRRVCAHPYILVSTEIEIVKKKKETEESFVDACMCSCLCVHVSSWACLYLYMQGCFVYDALWPQLRSHARERNDIRTHFLFQGFRAYSFALLTRDVWNVRQVQITANDLPQGLVSLPVSWEQLCSERVCQEEVTASFCSGDFLSCPGQRGRLKCIEEP